MRTFTKNTANYMNLGAVNAVGALLDGAAKISVHLWARPGTLDGGAAGSNRLFWVPMASNVFGISMNVPDATGAFRLRANARSVSTDGSGLQADGTTILSPGTLYGLGAVFDFVGDMIRVYVNGVEEAATAAAFANSAYTHSAATQDTGIGKFAASPPASTAHQWAGELGEPTFWRDDIGAAGFAQLADGALPYQAAPGPLEIRLPILGNASPEPELVAGLTAVITGTLAKADHPRLYRFAAGGGA